MACEHLEPDNCEQCEAHRRSLIEEIARCISDDEPESTRALLHACKTTTLHELRTICRELGWLQ